MKKQYLLTKSGVAELEAEHSELVGARAEVADRIKTAREFGDLSENAEYQSARADQEKLEARISEIEHILQNVEVIKKPKGAKNVQIGNEVKLVNNGKSKVFTVVGTVEANPLEGKISDESPLGMALLGKAVGEVIEIATPAETANYRISSIS